MAGIALSSGNDLNLSLYGVLEVLLLGTLVGAVGGLMLLALRRALKAVSLVRGLLLGIIVFACSWIATLLSSTEGSASHILQWSTLATSAAVCALYGVSLDVTLDRLAGGTKEDGEAES